MLPWLALAPAALATTVMRPMRDVRRQGIYWFGAIWFVAAYALVSLSVTKFHHYILPALPGLAIVIGCFLDDLLERRDGPRGGGDRGGRRAAAGAGDRRSGVGAEQRAALHLAVLVRLHQHAQGPALAARARTTERALIGFAVVVRARHARAGLAAHPALGRAGACALAAIVFTFFLLDGYMRQVTPYWTQKGLIATYYRTRRSPDEKLLVWQMYWRGENFYTENEIYEGPPDERTVFLGDHNVENLKDWVAKHRGHRAFLLVERSRTGRASTAWCRPRPRHR